MDQLVFANYALYAAYIFMGVTAFLTVLFPIIQMVQDFRKALVMLAALCALVLLFFVCYWMGTAEPYSKGDVFVGAEKMQLVDTFLYMAYTMMGLTVLSIIVTSFSRYIK